MIEGIIVFVLIFSSMGVLAWALSRKGGGCAGCGGGESCSMKDLCPDGKEDEQKE
ncbi:MAG: hypothetical protein ACOCVI_03900 [Planctomycetota bacterium]